MFDLRRFRTPPAINAMGYFWFLNDELNPAETVAQLRDMARVGARSVCPHPVPKEFRDYFMSEMRMKYLSKEFFRQYRVIVDECARIGMNCYLYDEGGWPSGGACGQVLESDPERFVRRIVVPDGKDSWRIDSMPTPPGKSGMPNLLMREVTDRFLELTHEQYAKHFGKTFGKTFHFAFMDEPATPTAAEDALPWCPDMFEEFEKRKGYDVTPYLGAMLRPIPSAMPEVTQARSDYLDVVSQLFAERFVRPVTAWCRRHKLLSGGHFSVEDDQENCILHDHGAHTLRVLRELDFPGVDVIWRQLWPGMRLNPFPKFASSAAAQNGNKFVLAEVFGVYGSGITPAQMKFIIDYMAVCGINTFVGGVLPYTTRNGQIGGERPFFGRVNPLWRHMKPYHDAVARLCRLMTTGRPAAETALFFDTLNLWRGPMVTQHPAAEQEKIAYRLLEQQSDFDFVDDDVLAKARLHRGKLKVGPAEYGRLVLPVDCRMTDAARKKVDFLRSRGLAVLTSDETADVPPTLEITPRDWRFRVCKRALPGGNALYMILNVSQCAVTRTFRAAETGPAALCDTDAGRLCQVKRQGGAWEWSFGPLDSAVFLVGPDAAKAEPAPMRPGKTLAELDGWKLRPVRQTKVGAHDYEIFDLKRASAKPVRLGDWRKTLGDDFSGEAVYTTEFDGKGLARAAFLDLGDVRYLAEVRLNGQKVGTVWRAPFVLDVRGRILPGRNSLAVTVVNTLANAISPLAVYERWKRELPFMWPYEERQRTFERESLASGLFGPVVLKAAAKEAKK